MANWYVVHTYTGYEKKVESIIEKYRETDAEFASYCTGVKVPMEQTVVTNDKGEKKIKEVKILPGYILVELDLPERTWRTVTGKIARIQGVTGFLNADKSGQKPPIPLTQAEHSRIMRRTGEVPEEKLFRAKEDFSRGDEVKITAGPFNSFTGTVEEVDIVKGKLRLSVQIFGRATPVEVEFLQVEKVSP